MQKALFKKGYYAVVEALEAAPSAQLTVTYQAAPAGLADHGDITVSQSSMNSWVAGRQLKVLSRSRNIFWGAGVQWWRGLPSWLWR